MSILDNPDLFERRWEPQYLVTCFRPRFEMRISDEEAALSWFRLVTERLNARLVDEYFEQLKKACDVPVYMNMAKLAPYSKGGTSFA